MKKSIAFSILVLGLSISQLTHAQTFEGQLTYSIEYLELSAEMRGMESMLPKTMDMHLKGSKMAIIQSLMGGNQTVLYNSETEESAILMDMMGQKIAIQVSKEEERAALEQVGEPELIYQEGSRDILGYPCKKAILKTGENEVEVWYTKEIKGASHRDFKTLDGFPLQYLAFQQGMKIQMTVTKIAKSTQSDNQFNIPEGYQRISMTEYSKMMGGGY